MAIVMTRRKEDNSMSFHGPVTSFFKLPLSLVLALGDMKACKEGVMCNGDALRQT